MGRGIHQDCHGDDGVEDACVLSYRSLVYGDVVWTSVLYIMRGFPSFLFRKDGEEEERERIGRKPRDTMLM